MAEVEGTERAGEKGEQPQREGAWGEGGGSTQRNRQTDRQRQR